jgi:methionyl-tRNA formyltransferase
VIDVIFMGTPDYADVILKKLIDDKDINVVAVYTQPDKPVGRKKVLTPPPVKVTAQKAGIALYQPNRLRDSNVIEELLKIECDYIVVAAYGQILPREILEHAPCINLHASILPQYRGASPIQQTLLNGDSYTGVTAMLMEEGLDTGDILKIEKIPVDKSMMLEELFERLTTVAADLTLDVLKNFKNYTPLKQNEDEATHCKKITKADGKVTFDDAEILYNKYRALTPWPGVYLESGLKLKKLKLEDLQRHHSAGEILEIDKESVVVGCKRGSVRIFRLQPPSKKEMDAVAYVHGKRLRVADYLV